MKLLVLFLSIFIFYFSATANAESLSEKSSSFGNKVGVPLVVDDDTKPILRTGIAKTNENVKNNTQQNETKTEDEEESSENEMNEGNEEENGSGYEKIKGMDPDDDDSSSGSGSGSGSDNEELDLNGDFPPNADQVYKLPKEVHMTADQVDRKMVEKRKGYISFTIKQRFKPDFKFKESSAYKILSGNVIHDVERSLKTTGAVKDILFREAKDEIPYRQKVEVFMKLNHKINQKRLQKFVDHGLINGMTTIPGSFRAN